MQSTIIHPKTFDTFQLTLFNLFLKQFKHYYQTVTNLLFVDCSKPQVHRFSIGDDVWWYAFDPKQGKSVYADTEEELRIWIEKNCLKD